MIVWLLYFIVTVLVGIVTALIVYARWNYGTLEKMEGIPVVKPSFIFGSEPNIHNKVVHDEDLKYFKKYGPIWGYYEGRAPHLYICDPELMRLILIKDFDYFHSKRVLNFGHPLINEMLDLLPGEKWKVVRNFLTPTLTTGKIKNMSYQMIEAINDMTNDLQESCPSSSVLDVKQIYSQLTIDIIARCAFGTKLDSIGDEDNIFVKFVKRLTGDTEDANFILTVALTFPFINNMAPFIPTDVLDFFGDVLGKIMKLRRAENIKQNDFVDLLNEMVDKIPTPEYQRLGINEQTVMAQAILFLFAGFDTTATALTMLSYRLATNPEKQKKLIEEVDQYMIKNKGKIVHETVGELVYMNACMNETLRLCAPLIRVERVCQKDWRHEKSGLEIKKGMVVQISNWAVNYNPDAFPEPEKFIPERFMPENKDKFNQYAFMSFGQGPHHCVGMRFAQEEVKLTMANILKDFTFAPCDETKLEFKTGKIFLIQFHPVKLNVIRRKK